MTTEQTKSQLTANRYANQTELDHAIATLHSLGESAFAGLVENAIKHGIESYRPLVVTDFNAVGETQILLVPAGTHALPQTVLQTPRFIIGLPESGKNKPTLMLVETETDEVFNFDTDQSTRLQICHAEQCKFVGICLDASQPTIMEMYIGTPTFSDRLLYVECSANVDVYNLATTTLRESRSWALEAYGESMCSSQNQIEKRLDVIHEGGLKVIDAVFKPLVDIGYRLDKLFGLK